MSSYPATRHSYTPTSSEYPGHACTLILHRPPASAFSYIDRFGYPPRVTSGETGYHFTNLVSNNSGVLFVGEGKEGEVISVKRLLVCITTACRIAVWSCVFYRSTQPRVTEYVRGAVQQVIVGNHGNTPHGHCACICLWCIPDLTMFVWSDI